MFADRPLCCAEDDGGGDEDEEDDDDDDDDMEEDELTALRRRAKAEGRGLDELAEEDDLADLGEEEPEVDLLGAAEVDPFEGSDDGAFLSLLPRAAFLLTIAPLAGDMPDSEEEEEEEDGAGRARRARAATAMRAVEDDFLKLEDMERFLEDAEEVGGTVP